MTGQNRNKPKVTTANQARRALSNLLRQDATYGSVAFVGLCDIWGPDWLQWEPKTVQLEIKDDLGVYIEPDLFDKIMAARQVITTDDYLQSVPVFITLCNALNGDGVDTPISQPIDPADICWAVTEMMMLWPDNTFNEEVTGYIEEALKWQGVRTLPKALQTMLPEATFDELEASDPDVMEAIFQKVVDINDEVESNLNAWKYQMGQLNLMDGTLEWLQNKRA